jgi:hypothetical protein
MASRQDSIFKLKPSRPGIPLHGIDPQKTLLREETLGYWEFHRRNKRLFRRLLWATGLQALQIKRFPRAENTCRLRVALAHGSNRAILPALVAAGISGARAPSARIAFSLQPQPNTRPQGA